MTAQLKLIALDADDLAVISAHVQDAKVQPGENVAVFGIGGLGHLALQYAHIVGGTVIGIDIEPEKLALATKLGAHHTVDASAVDPVAAIHELGGADVALAFAVSPRSFEQAFASLRPGGRLVCVGLPRKGVFEVPIFDTVLKGISIIGSIVGTRQDLREVFALHAAGRTRVLSEVRELEDINESMSDVLSGRIPARVVVEF